MIKPLQFKNLANDKQFNLFKVEILQQFKLFPAQKSAVQKVPNFHYISSLSTYHWVNRIIMFDHCQYQNIHSHSQTRCFKELTNIRRKGSVYVRGRGGGVEKLFGRFPFEQHFF